MAGLEKRIMEGEIRASYARGAEGFAPLPFSSQDVRKEIRRTKNRRLRRGIIAAFVVLLIACAVIACLVLQIPSRMQVVETAAMEPAIGQGATVLMQANEDLGAGDVVKYRTLAGETRFGRIIGCPGEWVGITNRNQVALSNEVMAEGSVVQRSDGDATIISCTLLPALTYFVLADADPITDTTLENPDYFILSSQIEGRAIFKMWPPASIGPVQNNLSVHE